MQSTQDRIGPYELHDFFLYHTMRYGQRPSKVAFLAWHAWQDAKAGLWPIDFPEARKRAYDLATIRKWLEVFLFRFFQLSQFKRSACRTGRRSPRAAPSPARGDWPRPQRRHRRALARSSSGRSGAASAIRDRDT